MNNNYPVFSFSKLLVKIDNKTLQATLGHPYMTNNFNEWISNMSEKFSNPHVMCFDQQTDASQAVCWSKSSFQHFHIFFCHKSQMEIEEKVQEKAEK